MSFQNEPPWLENPDSPAFTTEERTVTHVGNFSLRLTEAEMNAYRIQVIVAPFYVGFRPYENRAYNPIRSLFLRGTAWSQDVGVTRDFMIQYASQVIMDYRNEGMLTRWWQTVLFWFALKREALSSLLVAEQLGAIPGLSFATYTNSAPVKALEWQNFLMASEIPERQAEDGTPVLPVLGFAPPETLWKFSPDQPDIWTQATVKVWYLPEIPTLPIALPSAEQEEPDSSPDSQAPGDFPTSGEPPDPSDESPRDPRNSEDDYTSAPDPEEPPEEPSEPQNVIVSVSGNYGWRSPEGIEVAGGAIGFACGTFRSPPVPIAKAGQVPGTNDFAWYLEALNASGQIEYRVIRPRDNVGFTAYGQPVVTVTPC